MAIQVVCPGCSATFRAKDEWAGRQAPCPKCKAPLTIPASENAAPTNSTPANSTPTSTPAAGPQPIPATPVAAAAASEAAGSAPAFPAIQLDLGTVNTKGKTAARKPIEKKPALATTASEATTAPGGRAITIQLKHLVMTGVAGMLVIGLAAFGIVWALRGPQESQAGKRPDSVAAPLPTTSTVAKPQDLADVLDRVKRGVVLIKAWDSRGEVLAIGSGFLIAPGGIAVTNHHVMAGSARLTAQFFDGLIAEVDGVLSCDEKRDIVILKLNYAFDSAVPLKLAPQMQLRPGARVVAVGHPHGLEYSASQGIVSAIRTTHDLPEATRNSITAPADHQWIQTDAAISHGNSGGPLLTPEGEVIGINTWVESGENLGFASHARYIEELLVKAKVTATPEKVADYNKRNGGLKRAIVSQVDRLAEYLSVVLTEVEKTNWRPASDDDRMIIEHTAKLLYVASYNGISLPEIEEFGTKLAAIEWSGADQVAPLNALAQERLEGAYDKKADSNGIVLFGEIRKVRSDGSYEVRLADQTTEAAVSDLFKVKTQHAVGDQVLVIGSRTEDDDASMPSVAAAIAVKVKWMPPTKPSETNSESSSDSR